jgi:hypothetical protein
VDDVLRKHGSTDAVESTGYFTKRDKPHGNSATFSTRYSITVEIEH